MKIKSKKIDAPTKDDDFDIELDFEKYHEMVSFKPEWNLGDFCIYNMEICQIASLDKSTKLPNSVSNGVIRSYIGTTLKDYIYPITLTNISIANYFYKEYEEIRKCNRNLNFPDVHRYFDLKCRECIDAKDNKEKFYKEIEKFKESVIEIVRKRSDDTVDGVKIFRN